MSDAPTFPPGGTIVQTFKRSFTDVKVDPEAGNAIDTTEFLEAAEALTTMFDGLGSVAFSPVKKDMLFNIGKLRERQTAAPAESQTVQDLIRNELKTGKHTATEGCLWLVRGLDFTCVGLANNVANPTQEVADSFRESYAKTLKMYHNWMVKPIFSAAMAACPYRKDFYPKLGASTELVTQELRVYLAALEKIVAILKGFLDSKEAKW